MTNPLKDSRKNPLKRTYEDLWVPIFGRLLNLFSSWIEGQATTEKQTYDLHDKSQDI